MHSAKKSIKLYGDTWFDGGGLGNERKICARDAQNYEQFVSVYVLASWCFTFRSFTFVSSFPCFAISYMLLLCFFFAFYMYSSSFRKQFSCLPCNNNMYNYYFIQSIAAFIFTTFFWPPFILSIP